MATATTLYFSNDWVTRPLSWQIAGFDLGQQAREPRADEPRALSQEINDEPTGFATFLQFSYLLIFLSYLINNVGKTTSVVRKIFRQFKLKIIVNVQYKLTQIWSEKFVMEFLQWKLILESDWAIDILLFWIAIKLDGIDFRVELSYWHVVVFKKLW